MFDNFDNEAISAILHAQNEAHRLRQPSVGTECLILGLQSERTGIASQALKSTGITVEDQVEEIEHAANGGKEEERERDSIDLSFSPRCKEIFRTAREIATDLGDDVTNTEHLLLAMIKEGSGRGVDALLKLSVDLQTLSHELLRLRHERAEEAKNRPPVHFQQGDVVLVAFVEHDEEGNPITRRRPLVIVSTNSSIPQQNTLVMAPLIQAPNDRPRSRFEVPIEAASPSGKSAGLSMDSSVACSFVYSYPKSWCVAKVGKLPADDIKTICEQVWESIKPE